MGSVIGHHIHTATVELYTGRLARGFGMWRAFKVAAQETRMAAFNAHIQAFVRHTRRLVLQFGFRRWLVWTWQDRFVTLEEQFGACQNALVDREMDVKRLEHDNAVLESSLRSDGLDRSGDFESTAHRRADSPTPVRAASSLSRSQLRSRSPVDDQAPAKDPSHSRASRAGRLAAERWLSFTETPARQAVSREEEAPGRVPRQRLRTWDDVVDAAAPNASNSRSSSPRRRSQRKTQQNLWDEALGVASARVTKGTAEKGPR